ncbi:hypothetical protein SK128_013604 [Halocaridina rubra]|uniref:Ionotropic glutamate receptor C-terminal domain-containing protein n=1 Tax=Halocaridina rubra TaxID=373956 RepID=A0AAN8XQ29_HALRR
MNHFPSKKKNLSGQSLKCVWASMNWKTKNTDKLFTCWHKTASAWWPRGDAVRIMTGLWLFMIFILCSVYKSNLKAMMIMPSLPLPFNNIEELISSRIPTFVFAGSMLTQAMMNAPPGSHLDQLRGQTVQHANISKLSKDLLQGKIAVFLGKRAFTYLLHQKFAEVSKKYKRQKMAIGKKLENHWTQLRATSVTYGAK